MNSLITSDISTSADKALTNPWKGAEAIHFFLLCQRQLYQHKYKEAMKTAMRLIEYEKELSTREVYSVVAIACLFNQCYKDCSKAFVKLERLEGLSKEEREKYENLAFQLFSRHPPVNHTKTELKCPKSDCNAVVSEYDINCRECGSHFSPCIASGQSILAKDYYTCKNCKHKALQQALSSLKLRHCTLCHGKLEQNALDNVAQPNPGRTGVAASKTRK